MEENLVHKLKAKNQHAWKQMYSMHADYLTFVCKRYIYDLDQVRDILQNSFIKMFNGIEKFEYKGEGSLKAWITRIVVNEALKTIKENSKLTFASFPEDYQDDPSDEPDLDYISKEEILEAIQTLPDGYRIVFNLYVFENKNHKEISQLLNISEGTSASQYHRAKKMLANKLNHLKSFKKAAL